MDNFKERIIMINEQAYPNNIGFSEMVKFYQVANPAQIDKMEGIIKASDWDAFKKLIKSVLGVKLK